MPDREEKTQEEKREDAFDVCVIGTGAGGGVLIQELTAAGFDVVALEKGPFLQGSDFGEDEVEVILRDELFARDQIETWRARPEDPVVTGRFNRLAHCVGGSLTRWGGWSWRLREDAFRVRSSEGDVEGANLADWPIRYEDLESWYEKAEWDFGVAGAGQANPWAAPRKRAYPHQPHRMRPAARLFEQGARKAGLTPYPLPVAINPRPYRGREACTYGGACLGFGCRLHARASTLSVSIHTALATGRLDLRPNATAVDVPLGEDGRARGVRYLDWKGRDREVRARHVFVAAGGIGTPMLLLRSRSGAFPDGLANSSGLVGRNLMFHVAPAALFTTDEPALGFTGPSGQMAVDDYQRSDPSRGFIRGGVIVETNELTATPAVFGARALRGAPDMERAWGASYKKLLESFPRTTMMRAVLEDLPVESNRVTPDPDVRDSRGLPAPRITHRQHPNDLALHDWILEKMGRIADAAGAVRKWIPDLPGETWVDEEHPVRGSPLGHILGTCRMGDDPSRSVVNGFGRAHDVPNLWIVDGSTFPTSGGHPPALTILAQAYRVAEHFVTEVKKRNS